MYIISVLLQHLLHFLLFPAATMDAKQIIHCALQIEKSAADRSYGNLVTLLADLDKTHIPAEQLESTDVVKVLYRLLKTCSDDGVKKVVKRLLSKWKRQYSQDTRGAKCAERSDGSTLSHAISPPGGDAADVADDKALSEQGDPHTTQGRMWEDGWKTGSSDVSDDLQSLSEDGRPPASSASSDFSCVRSKCVQLLLGALCSDDPSRDQAADLARHIERHLHELHKANQLKYKARVRSKVANLRNPKNAHLREGLLSGSLSPESFARMSVEEMAGAELRQLREEFSSRGVSERQLPQGVEGLTTQKIRCKRCGGSDCRVTQVSRGALFLPAWVRPGGPDEDAMTFATCNGCGQQWYHSSWVCL